MPVVRFMVCRAVAGILKPAQSYIFLHSLRAVGGCSAMEIDYFVFRCDSYMLATVLVRKIL